VRSDGTLNRPYVGVVAARGRRLDELEAEVERGYRRDYVDNATVRRCPTPDRRREAGRVPPASREWLLRAAESLGRWQAPLPV